ncbi:cytochrome c [Solirubrobacter sp. CPCC 204708]|uniref:Cytochrome c n=1 Tax=Solirubrobacter deserti TaxID=2282478 RepID=A0ABT4RNZ5_9ACTN|nr:cytochrome c [Solirubrobacter deserti]MBE2317533.1 cytochrome c [Solirubrobacter deserti]MDA0140291.1 cytochrome c [Solirubrobacter deserti]
MRATTLAAGGLACAGAAMTIAAFAAGGDDPAPTAARATPARDGLSVFVAQGCGSCHTFEPANSSAPIGPDLEVALVGKSRDDVKRAIVAPPRNGPMPEDFATRISPPELEQLVTFLLSAQ